MNIDPKQIDQGMIDAPTQTVAMVAVQAIGELSDLLYKNCAHDESSERMVMGLCAWLTSVLDGKDPEPANALLNASKAIEQSLIDELARSQHYLAEMVERTKKAESTALVNDQYARWYLRLRDDEECYIGAYEGVREGDQLLGEELDIAMEDLDAEDRGNDIDKPSAGPV
jgi:hypothetical protein